MKRIVLACVAFSTLLACTPPMGAALQATVTVSSNGAYAAMDEIPVTGGELRLVEPRWEEDRGGVQREVIGFPLQHTAVEARVVGAMGVYQIEQVFENPFDVAIEAVYVFPLGDDAAVSGYQMVIGERIIDGEIRTRAEARTLYNEAKAAGHTAALVEQDRPNVFAQRIANIAPRETIRVRITYVELIDHADGAYQLAVPLVVAPRYRSASAGAPREPASYVEPTVAGSTVSFVADLDGGFPITDLESPSHDIEVEDLSGTRVRVSLAHRDEVPNRDIVLRYRLSGARTMVGLSAHRTGDEGYFVLTVQPKDSYRTGDIVAREVVLVIDRSGSMDGVPLAQAKALATAVIDTLTERDTLNVLAFSSNVVAMSEAPVAGDDDGKRLGRDFVDGLASGGGTELEQGLLGALAEAPGGGRTRIVYLFSDGLIGDDELVISAARDMLGHNRIFPVGIGSAPNRYLIDRLAEVGRGFSSYLGLTEPAEGLAPQLVRRSAYPYLTDVSIDWGELEVTDITPARIPDVYAGLPVIVSGRYRTPGRGQISVAANTAGGQRTVIRLDVDLPAEVDAEPVAALWARRQIEGLLRGAGAHRVRDVEEEVTALALRFHLVTEFTSFVAVERARVVGAPGVARTVDQPAVIPEGMTPAPATAAPAPADPEPAYRSYDSGDSGGGWSGGWSSGGDEDPAPIGRMIWLLTVLPVLWMVLRRCVG